MKLMMKMDELEETLESQEELLRLERGTSKTLARTLPMKERRTRRLRTFSKPTITFFLR